MNPIARHSALALIAVLASAAAAEAAPRVPEAALRRCGRASEPFQWKLEPARAEGDVAPPALEMSVEPAAALPVPLMVLPAAAPVELQLLPALEASLVDVPAVEAATSVVAAIGLRVRAAIALMRRFPVALSGKMGCAVLGQEAPRQKPRTLTLF